MVACALQATFVSVQPGNLGAVIVNKSNIAIPDATVNTMLEGRNTRVKWLSNNNGSGTRTIINGLWTKSMMPPDLNNSAGFANIAANPIFVPLIHVRTVNSNPLTAQSTPVEITVRMIQTVRFFNPLRVGPS